MSSSKATRALKQFFAGYHEPTTLSPRQSEKLLDGLKQSFRTQLDREFGPGVRPAGAATHAASSAKPARDSASMKHLQSILVNPLFTHDAKSAAKLAANIPKTENDPMSHFDEAVRRGMMTLQAATGCMMAKRKQILATDGSPELASSQTASRVTLWLKASGREADMEFLDNARFIEVLVPFLVAEGLHDIAWKWIIRTMENTQIAHTAQRLRVRNLLNQLVRGQIHHDGGEVDGAIGMILQAEALLRQNPALPYLLLHPWRSVSWLSTAQFSGNPDYRASEDLFEAHVATSGLLPRPVPVETAHLHLLHPKSPDPEPALALLHDRKALQKSVMMRMPGAAPSAISMDDISNDMSIIAWIECLVRDTVSYLGQNGMTDDARRLMDKFSKELNLNSHSVHQPA